jgi:drug/metabolite transporter (DMT)-like permease
MSDRVVLLRLFSVSLLWGANYVASAYLLEFFSPIILSFLRLTMTSLFLVAVAFLGRKLQRPARKQWGLLFLAGIFGVLMNQFFYFTGLQESTAGNAALIVALSPIATTFLAWMFLKEKISFGKVGGAFIALCGVIMVIAFSGASFGITRGDIYLLLAMLAMSLSLLFTRKLTATMSAYDITIFSTVFGTMLMSPTAVIEVAQSQAHVSWDPWIWVLLIVAAILGQGLAGFWWNQAISQVGASTSSMFLNIPPFVAIVVAHFVLGDPIHLSQIVGGVLILAGVTVSNRKWSPPRVATPTTPAAPAGSA